jgi:hypothetical protein
MNPYKVLSVDKNVSNKEVIQAVALAMRSRKYSTKEIAQAQQMLLDPVSRGCHKFLYFIDLGNAKDSLIQEIKNTAEACRKSEMDDGFSLEYLPLFENNHG